MSIELTAAELAGEQAAKELREARKVIRTLERDLARTQKNLDSHRDARLRFLIAGSNQTNGRTETMQSQQISNS